MTRIRSTTIRLLILALAAETIGWTTRAEPARTAVPPASLPPMFARLPVLHGGRAKPIGSAARQVLLELAGKRSCPGKTPEQWLANVLFARDAAGDDPVFLIDDPAIAEALGIPNARRGRYSLNQLKPVLEELDRLYAAAAHRPSDQRSRFDVQIGQLHQRVVGFLELPERVRPIPHCETEWKTLATAYRRGAPSDLEQAVAAYRRAAARHIGRTALAKVDAEAWMNRIRPFFLAQLLYGVSILLYLFSRMGRCRLLIPAAMSAGVLGTLFHTAGIAARMWIMSRPPVTNLYSTFVFVGWMCAVLGLLIYRVRDRDMGALSTGLSGLVFLLLAGRYAAEGDTMGVMAAVLNSNFWLTCHVMTVTTGYAGCCLAGLVAHFYLVRAWRRPEDRDGLDASYRTLKGVLGLGLTFTFIGTVFGGIWADQSWGRFWGWDPKENGALMIVLWCSVLFHARLAGFLSRTGVAVGAVAGIQLVLLAWLGVNMLGIGLHAYGAITSGGVVWALAAFFLFESAFVYVSLLGMHARSMRSASTVGRSTDG